ncbi:MAG TPA: hypothetical protein VIN08_28440 [Ohtaekwangia sp.]|uniref:hypothetical protein n=1 Tax=Ohtaekwangia sp. TaxID=2066019 RepID=UPI002F932D06
MYIYKARSAKTNELVQKEFSNEFEAQDFASGNEIEHPHYTIRDADGEIVWSDRMAKEERDASDDNMFPDEDSREGFDYTDIGEDDD